MSPMKELTTKEQAYLIADALDAYVQRRTTSTRGALVVALTDVLGTYTRQAFPDGVCAAANRVGREPTGALLDVLLARGAEPESLLGLRDEIVAAGDRDLARELGEWAGYTGHDIPALRERRCSAR